ncbi:hypothetical protein ACFXKY_28525 [Streptomyces canus]|uniref:hypothetical protein n=1 Tax=Streptomyces canus TaxID=58343 RepID=UPI00369C0148
MAERDQRLRGVAADVGGAGGEVLGEGRRVRERRAREGSSAAQAGRAGRRPEWSSAEKGPRPRVPGRLCHVPGGVGHVAAR